MLALIFLRIPGGQTQVLERGWTDFYNKAKKLMAKRFLRNYTKIMKLTQ